MSSIVARAIETVDGERTNALQRARIPRFALALMEALQFGSPNVEPLESLNDFEWKHLLRFADANQLTLIAGRLCRPSLPDWVRVRIDENYAKAAERFERLNTALIDIVDSFHSRNIDFAALKGHAHAPSFTPDPVLRAQGDIDLWCLPEAVGAANDVLLGLGYVPRARANGRHLSPLVRPGKWSWRGDYFASDLPIPVDLHYALWDEKATRIAGPREHDFWQRRKQIEVAGRIVPVLCEPDMLAFATLHFLVHLLAGDLRLQRAWEIAHFLHTRTGDAGFSQEWHSLHPASLRSLEALVFRLVTDWFGCSCSTVVSEEARNLPADVQLWIERYGLRPIESQFNPNKNELWLHLALIGSARDRMHVFAKRILPLPHPAPQILTKIIPNKQIPDGGRLLKWKFRGRRFVHHARTLLPTVAGPVKWSWVRQRLGENFVRYLLSSALFDFGEFTYFVLFNLYLLDRGFDDKFLGQASALMTAGTIAGSIPTVALTRRLGLRPTLLLGLAGAPVLGALRAMAPGRISILASSFLMGMFMAIWAISFAPVISATTNERNRAFGFSLVSGLGIGLGSVAGLFAGHLPTLLAQVSPGIMPVTAKRTALLIGSAIALLGSIPMSRGTLEHSPAPSGRRIYPRSRFIWSFCTVLLIWSMATGAFNPFFNAYFAQHQHLSTQSIGLIFSASQLATVVAVLLAPVVLNTLGQVKGISVMQCATALTLFSLALPIRAGPAAALYIGYMSFQYMTEPCLMTMLMNRVSAGERSGASALNFLVIAAAGSVSAFVSGVGISRFGYSALLTGAAAVALISAFAFQILMQERPCQTAESPRVFPGKYLGNRGE